MKKNSFLFTLLGLIFFTSCKKDPVDSVPDKTQYGTTPYDFKKYFPASFPAMKIPSHNPTTEEGVALGKKLFSDPLLSGNNTQSCASCHQQNVAFVDSAKRVSRGSTGALGTRNTMPIFNLGFAKAFFWDGRAKSLEEQVFHPIASQNEMNQDPILLSTKLSKYPEYVKMYEAAFGPGEITFDKTAKAIAQFMRTIVAYTPKSYDTTYLSAAEKRGLKVFLDDNKGDCFHCHEIGNFMTTFEFANNGLNENPFLDPGLFAVTGNINDLGKFKVPSLINVKYTAPYMHDGRFKTLREVIDFYDTGFHWDPIKNGSLDANILIHFDKSKGKPKPRQWSEQDKLDIIEYINGLEDKSLLTNPQFSK